MFSAIVERLSINALNAGVDIFWGGTPYRRVADPLKYCGGRKAADSGGTNVIWKSDI